MIAKKAIKDFYQQSVLLPFLSSLRLLHGERRAAGAFGASRLLWARSFLLLPVLVVLIHLLDALDGALCPQGCLELTDDVFHEALLYRLTHWLLLSFAVVMYFVRYRGKSAAVVFSYLVARNWAMFLGELFIVSVSVAIHGMTYGLMVWSEPLFFLMTTVPLMIFFLMYQWAVVRQTLGVSSLCAAFVVVVDIALMAWVDAFSFPLALLSSLFVAALAFLAL